MHALITWKCTGRQIYYNLYDWFNSGVQQLSLLIIVIELKTSQSCVTLRHIGIVNSVFSIPLVTIL